MKTETDKILTRMIGQFESRNGRKPAKIVIAPVAMVVLGARRSLGAFWNGIRVEGRLFELSEAVKTGGTKLGVFVKNDAGDLRLAACDLA